MIKESHSESDDKGLIPAECWNSLQPPLPFYVAALNLSVDWHVLIVLHSEPLSQAITFFLDCSLGSTLSNMNIWLLLFCALGAGPGARTNVLAWAVIIAIIEPYSFWGLAFVKKYWKNMSLVRNFSNAQDSSPTIHVGIKSCGKPLIRPIKQQFYQLQHLLTIDDLEKSRCIAAAKTTLRAWTPLMPIMVLFVPRQL